MVAFGDSLHPHPHMSRLWSPRYHLIRQGRRLRAALRVATGAEERLAAGVWGASWVGGHELCTYATTDKEFKDCIPLISNVFRWYGIQCIPLIRNTMYSVDTEYNLNLSISLRLYPCDVYRGCAVFYTIECVACHTMCCCVCCEFSLKIMIY